MYVLYMCKLGRGYVGRTCGKPMVGRAGGECTVSDMLDFALGSAGVESAGYAAFAHGV
jgi:hypothetical protein